MTGTIYQGYALDDEGNVLVGASIEVRDQDTNSLVTIWSNRATTTTKTNPTTSDSNGYFFFYRTAGRYKITVTSGAFTSTFNNVSLGNAQELDTGTSAGKLVLYDDFGAVAFSNSYDDLDDLPTLGTMAALDSGTDSDEFRTNSQNDTRFLKVANNLNDVTASSARANLDLANIYSLEGVVTNTHIPLKRSGAFVDSPIEIDANDAASFTGNGPTTFNHDVDIDGTLIVSEHIKLSGDSVGTATDRWQGSDGSGSTVYNVPTSKGHIFAVNNATVATILAGGLDFIGTITATTGVRVATGQTTLANYLEGTYTATLTCSTSGTITLNSSFDTLSYTRIGNTVHVRGYIEVDSISSPVGDLRLNIPITSANPAESSGRSVGSIVLTNSSTKTANDFIVFVDENVSYASIILIDGSSIALTAASEVTASTTIFVGFSYQV